ncbi:hypothetical protein Agabi119p4_5862 [Agaricus bisporus var. burnettii]|nr:hypothetical protein Agabi119p4_5862 [Agaricus bisporus var. burnettii]
MVAPTWNDDWPQEVNIAVAGFTAALEIMKGIRLETNIALKNKNNARQDKEMYTGGEIILGLASSGLTPGGFSGSDASVAANLAANVSSATKAYTASLGKLKVGKAAARQARSQAEEKLAAHKINDFNLPSLDAALKSVQPKTIRRSNIERPAPHAASPVAVSSPLSSIPPSPGCSDGQVGYAIAPLPSNLQQGVVCPPTPPWAHPECPDPITGFPGQSHPKDSPTLPMALPEGTGSPAPADTTPTIPIGNCSGESPFQAPAQPLAEAPMDVDYPNSSGRSRTPSVSKLSEVDTLHAPMPIDSEQPCSADTEVATSVTTELSSPAAPEHASSSGAGFPAYVFAPPKVEPATHPASSWLQHMESMAAPGFPFLPNQFGMNPLHFSNGNSSFHPAFKNGVYGAGSMPFPASLHGPSTTPGGSSWTSAELSTKPHLPIYDLSGFPHFFPYSMHPADLPGPSLADHQLGIPPAEGKGKGKTKEKQPEPTLASLYEATGNDDDANYSPPEPAIFAVLPKDDDPPRPYAGSRHDIPGYDPLDVASISYWQCDSLNPAYVSANKKDSNSFTGAPELTKNKLARDAKNGLIKFARSLNSSPIPAGIRDTLRNEAGLLPSSMLHSRRTTLHIHTTNSRNLLCVYHRFSKKADSLHVWDGASLEVRKGISVTGVPYPRHVAAKQSDPVAEWVPGHLHCGCPEDLVFMEAILRKLTLVKSTQTDATETWQQTYMDPRTRAFAMTAFMDWTGLNPADFFKIAPDGKIRDDVYAELLDRQISVLQQRRQSLDSHPRTKPDNGSPSADADGSYHAIFKGLHPGTSPRKRKKASQSVDATLNALDGPPAPDDIDFFSEEEET